MIAKMVFSTAVALIFTQATGTVAELIDGMITSRFIGQDAYSAVSLLRPFTGMISLLASFLATGSQVVCARLVGTGEHEEANRVLTLSAGIAAVLSAAILAGCVFFPRQVFSVCGVSVEKYPEIYPRMLEYLHGFMPGIPALMLTRVLGPIVVMDDGKKNFALSATALCLTNVAGDLLNALVFHGGNFGMGLVMAVSYLAQLAVLAAHFFRKESYFRFLWGRFSLTRLRNVARAGSPTFVRKLATVLRDLLINRMNLAVALSTAAIAARGVQSDLNSLMFCVGMGVGQTVLAIGGIFHGAEDRKGLQRVFAASLRTALVIAGGAGAVCFAGADLLAGLYLRDPEAVALAAFSIRCMALSLVFDAVLTTFSHYLQSVENRTLVNLMNFGERLIIPVLMAFIMGRFFGSRGVLASIAVSKALLALTVLGILWAKNGHFPRSWEDLMLLPKSFGGAEEDNRYARLTSLEDVAAESEAAEQFSLEHGAHVQEARWISLFVEEMGGNIILHGNPRGRERVYVDLRIYASKGRITISLRDYCQVFDPWKYYEIHQGSDPAANLGIRLVMRLASDVRHAYTFNSNCILISYESVNIGPKESVRPRRLQRLKALLRKRKA